MACCVPGSDLRRRTTFNPYTHPKRWVLLSSGGSSGDLVRPGSRAHPSATSLPRRCGHLTTSLTNSIRTGPEGSIGVPQTGIHKIVQELIFIILKWSQENKRPVTRWRNWHIARTQLARKTKCRWRQRWPCPDATNSDSLPPRGAALCSLQVPRTHTFESALVRAGKPHPHVAGRCVPGTRSIEEILTMSIKSEITHAHTPRPALLFT